MRPVLLDTNVLMLLVVGQCDMSLLRRHKRVMNTFDPADYQRLVRLLAGYTQVVVTPGVLAECSNLLRQTDDRTSARLMAGLGEMIGQVSEHYVPSVQVVSDPAFGRLGLTDAALLDEVGRGTHLLTVDLDLYVAAMRRPGLATNLHHQPPAT